MIKTSRPVSWIRAARKDFEAFPLPVQLQGLGALTVAAEGGRADNVKPLHGFVDAVQEIVLRHRGDAYRIVYAVKLGADIWVLHAFQKKSNRGSKTPQREIELVHERLTQLKVALQ